MSEISTVGIVGAGTMGRRIAFGCVVCGKLTRLFDTVPSMAQQAVAAVRKLIEEREETCRLKPGAADSAMALLSVSPSLEACISGVDLAIETVPENVELKRRVFAEIDRYAAPKTLIGTNTSSIPGSWLADATGRPEKIFNFNFGHAGHPKVEVMGHPGTAPATLEAALAFVRSLDLIPILVKREIVGYASNRVWRAIKKEVLFLLNSGYATAEDIDRAWMLDWEVPIGPCGLMDKIGLDVVRDIEMVYHRASGDPSDRPPPLLLDMIAQGKLGEKSGQGFYTYPGPAYERAGWLKGQA
jgi:3-hydroxybutyryl-CoA dehydrogenase